MTTEITTIEALKLLGKQVSNWGRWGDDDELGTVNFITPEKRVAAARLVRSGRLFDLGMPFNTNGPQAGYGGRFNPIHLMSIVPMEPLGIPDGVIAADDIVTMPLSCATQWDSLAHIGYDGLFYNNTPANKVTARSGALRNSFDKMAGKLIGRGVLLDIVALRGGQRLGASEEVTADDLSAAEERQGVRVGSGDILLVRTGWYQHFLAGDRAAFMGHEAGLGLSTVPWLRDREVAAVALDNWGVEVLPCKVQGSHVPLHMVLIRDVGMPLGEMFNLEGLAADCASDGVWEFLFCGPGLNITGSVGSPITPVALK